MFVFCRVFFFFNSFFFVLYLWRFNRPLRSGMSIKLDKKRKKSIVRNVHEIFFRNNVCVIQLLNYCCDHDTVTETLRHFMISSDNNILYPVLLLNSCFCSGRIVLQTLGSSALYVWGYQHFLQVSVSSCLSSGPCLV